jgi:excinuclease ABC subunit A
MAVPESYTGKVLAEALGASKPSAGVPRRSTKRRKVSA